MPPPRISLPRFNVSPRHLYRHLLREASYLPPICAPYVSARIKEQFRKHQHEPQHFTTWMNTGRRRLRHLRAANTGDAHRLKEVFLHAFGRTGPLRRTLMSSLVLPEPPATSESSQTPAPDPSSRAAKMQAIYVRARSDTKYNKAFIDMWDFDKLQNFFQTQITHAKGVSPIIFPDTLKKPDPLNHIDEKNIWGNDLPLRELRARLKHFWRNAIKKVQPPLGAGEWETLRDLATKAEAGPLLRPPPRRPIAAPVLGDGEGQGKTWNWQPYASLPMVQIERERNAGMRESVDGFRYDPVPGAETRLSNRKIRRAARTVFEATAYLKRDDKTGKSEAIWGNLAPDLPVVAPEASYFFEGLNDRGETPEQPLSPAEKAEKARKKRERQRRHREQQELESRNSSPLPTCPS